MQKLIQSLTALISAVDPLRRRAKTSASERPTRQPVRRDVIETAIDNLPQGVLLFDEDERISIVNRTLIEMYRLSPTIVKPGCAFIDYLKHRADTGLLQQDPYEYRRQIKARIAEQKVTTTTGRTADGRTVAVVEKGLAGGGWVVTHEDISDRVTLEAKLAYQASHDALTNLSNRVALGDRVQAALDNGLPADRHFALLMLDLDRFKDVNDTLGHSVGDLLLQEVAERLVANTRKADIVARLGGDEFVVFMEVEPDSDEAELLAQRLIAVVSRSFEIQGHFCRVGASIGIANAPEDGADFECLLKNADMALYRSKADGRGTYHLFDRSLVDQAQARRQLEIDIRDAIDLEQFEMYYQPIYSFSRSEVCGFEALIRWNKPEVGVVGPNVFIPLAEETGLILEIGHWVLKTACREAAIWRDDISVAVNVSPAQFEARDFPQSVERALAESGLAAERLEMEITETFLLNDEARAHETLKRLREIGVKLALDDFGTGYSSLTTLRSFPFDKIKIDRSFVSDLNGSESDADAIVRAVAGLGASLGMLTTAEGVENTEQLNRVRALGCTQIQGYLIARPSPASDVAALLAQSGGIVAEEPLQSTFAEG